MVINPLCGPVSLGSLLARAVAMLSESEACGRMRSTFRAGFHANTSRM